MNNALFLFYFISPSLILCFFLFFLIHADVEPSGSNVGRLPREPVSHRGSFRSTCRCVSSKSFLAGQLSFTAQDLGTAVPCFPGSCDQNPRCCGHYQWGKKKQKKNTHTQKRALPHFKFWWSHLQVQLLVHLWAAPVAAIFRLLPGDDLLTTGGQSRWFVHDLQLSGSSGVCSLFFISSSTLKMWQLFGHSSITH